MRDTPLHVDSARNELPASPARCGGQRWGSRALVATLLFACLAGPACSPSNARAHTDSERSGDALEWRALSSEDFRWRFWGRDTPCPPRTVGNHAWTNGELERWCELPDGTHHGDTFIWFASGRRQWQARELHGARHGVEREYYPSGHLKREATWQDNELRGVQIWWSQAGIASSKCRYADGLKLYCWDPRRGSEPAKAPPPSE